MTDVATLAARFSALGHEARLEIVRQLLAAHPDGQVVGELQAELDIPGSTLTHHLDALSNEGLVTKTREGRFLRYRAASETLRGLLDFLYAECCQGPAAMPPPSGLVAIGGAVRAGSRARKPAGSEAGPGGAGSREDADDESPGASWRAW